MASTETALVKVGDRGEAVKHASAGRSGGADSGFAGPHKAALWLVSIDEELAVKTLSLLAPEHVRRLREITDRLGNVSQAQIQAVHEDFQRTLRQGPVPPRDAAAYIGRLATRAFGETKATEMMSSKAAPPENPAGSLERADVEGLAILLGSEHPQVTAAVLASLEPTRAAQLLKGLEPQVRKDVLARVAKLSQVPRAGLAEVERVLGAGLTMTDEKETVIDGVRTAAVLLNQLPANEAEEILEALTKLEESTAGAIRHAMFTFEDLAQLDKRGWQALLKEVQRDQLLPALKTASHEIRQKVFESLSKRAGEMLKDDLEVLGPVRLADVEQARQAIVDVALRLRGEGRLAVGGSGGEELV